MSPLHANTLRAANTLLDSDDEAGFARRRAVSSAYYALFQRLCALIAEGMSRAAPESAEYRRCYRLLDHRQCRDRLNQSAEFRADLGFPFAELQDIRQWADYSVASHPDDIFARSGQTFADAEAQIYCSKAAAAIGFIDGLELAQLIRLLVTLVVRDRP